MQALMNDGSIYNINRLLSKSNLKLLKGAKYNYLSYGLSFAPHTISGYNVCPHATAGCKAVCIFTAGNGTYPAVTTARIAKTLFYFQKREEFKKQLLREISLAVKLAKLQGKKLCIRLNVFSDIAWEKVFPEIFTMFPTVKFYDYTKNPRRMKAFIAGNLPKNYYITFSHSETNNKDVKEILSLGGNVAVPFRLSRKALFPKMYNGYPVANGDKHDLRFLDKKNVIVGLKSKGSGGRDITGFIVKVY